MTTTDYEDMPAISWFPGHMLKAEKQLADKLKLIDLVIEVADARAPDHTRNYRLGERIAHKKTLLIINKCDLANADITDKWQSCFREQDLRHVLHQRNSRAAEGRLRKAVHDAVSDAQTRLQLVGNSAYRPVRAMVIGMPNVGKSTIINKLVRKRTAETGPKPGVTRNQQWVKVNEHFELLDTPGIMIPRIESRESGLILGLLAVIRDKVLHLDHLSGYLIDRFEALGNTELLTWYGLPDFAPSHDAFLDQLAARRGFVRPGKAGDRRQACICLINDFRKGRLGRISFTTPPLR